MTKAAEELLAGSHSDDPEVNRACIELSQLKVMKDYVATVELRRPGHEGGEWKAIGGVYVASGAPLIYHEASGWHALIAVRKLRAGLEYIYERKS